MNNLRTEVVEFMRRYNVKMSYFTPSTDSFIEELNFRKIMWLDGVVRRAVEDVFN